MFILFDERVEHVDHICAIAGAAVVKAGKFLPWRRCLLEHEHSELVAWQSLFESVEDRAHVILCERWPMCTGQNFVGRRIARKLFHLAALPAVRTAWWIGVHYAAPSNSGMSSAAS